MMRCYNIPVRASRWGLESGDEPMTRPAVAGFFIRSKPVEDHIRKGLSETCSQLPKVLGRASVLACLTKGTTTISIKLWASRPVIPSLDIGVAQAGSGWKSDDSEEFYKSLEPFLPTYEHSRHRQTGDKTGIDIFR
jgi:hypothetical protein